MDRTKGKVVSFSCGVCEQIFGRNDWADFWNFKEAKKNLKKNL
jgi:hypothetical protein